MTLPPPTLASPATAELLPPPTAVDSPPTPSQLAAMRRAQLAERNQRRSRAARRFAFGILSAAVLGCVGVVWMTRSGEPSDVLPDATGSSLSHRSATISERAISPTGSESNLVRVDLIDHGIAIDSEKTTASALLRDDRWYAPDGLGELAAIPTDEFLEALERRIITRADGFSIDEAIPPAARPFVDVTAVTEAPIGEHPTRRFDLVVRASDLVQADPATYAAFSTVWGTQEQTPSPDIDRMPSGTYTMIRSAQLSLWVDDDGWVWRWSSTSNISASSIEGELIDLSDEPFEPSLPVPVSR